MNQTSSWEALNMRFIVGEIVFFNIVGNFGNFQVIYLNCKSKRLQSKSATLQCILSLFQSFCLLSTLHNAFGILEDETYTRRECYPLLAPYVFFICFQAVLMLLLPIDMLFAILAPHRYRQINTKKYILGMLLFPLTYSSALMAWGFEKMDDQPVRYCNPPTGMHPDVAKCWMITNLVINTAVLALFVVLIIHIKTQGRSMNKADSQRRRRTSRAVRRLLILMAVFIGSWYICILGVYMILLNFQGQNKDFLHSNWIFFALVCFSESFYILLWRSKEHRDAFLRQFSCFMGEPAKFSSDSRVPDRA